MTIRTRFAPSPTGYLHIGGVRTALFNWLLTRRHGGQFILRIDDTDQERNRPEALAPILEGFRWLGIHWDEGPEIEGPHGPYFQSERNHLYVEAAESLVDSGHAYPCYRTPAELDAERKEAQLAKRPYVHRGQHRDTPAAECRRLLSEKRGAIRLKVPPGQTLAIDDLIRGHVEWQSDLIGDPVILRPDGRALYNFATVVDDVGMAITHVIRAAEHLSNTAVQVVAYEALGHPVPQFAHVPVVNEPNSKKKLSKRDMKKFVTPEVRAKLHAVGWSDADIDSRDDLNPAAVAFYRELGYLPAALVNYLGRLGWSLDDKTEIIPLDNMIENFSLDRVNQSSASFDPDKLYWLAGEYMRMLPIEERVAGVIPFLERAGLCNPNDRETLRPKIKRIVEASSDRLKLFSDILLYGGPLLSKEPAYQVKAVEKRLKKAGVPELLREFQSILRQTDTFDAAHLEETLRRFCEQKQQAPAPLIHALRVATTGTEIGPGVFDCLSILGRDETLRRIELALKLVIV